MTPLTVILPAAGSSTRFGRNKLLEPLAGTPVLTRTINALRQHPAVRRIIVATSDPATEDLARSIDPERIVICPGGRTRADSVRSALLAAQNQGEWIAVHDAARPLVSRELIERTFTAALEFGAAVPAMPVSLTVKEAAGPLPAKVLRTLNRNALWAMQTPQIARTAKLLQAFERCPIPLDQITDDMQLLELQGKAVWLVAGDERNLKITTPLDLKLAELLLRESGAP
jgi:2-C-methyl-D-erythritol 4-phosphate cytidylyltransferase